MPRVATASTLRADEIAHFSALAAQWWDARGPMAPLHKLNPTRLEYITGQIKAAFGTQKPAILDLGCGAGLVSENLAKAGFPVTGVDGSAELIEAARAHATQEKVKLTYRTGTAESLVAAKEKFPVVLALEIIEHTADAAAFAHLATQLVAPGGLIIFSTLNRTAKGFLLGIVGAEYVLRWLPAGTHDFRRFVRPSELTAWLTAAKLSVTDITGLRYQPLHNRFALDTRDVAVNYFLAARKA